MKRWLVLLYGVLAYAAFQGVFLYSVLFLGNLFIERSLDGEPTMAFWPALGINLALLAVFAVQHSGMARPAFKKWLTRYVPEPMERSTYVWASNLCMIVLFLAWQPMGGMVWQVESPVATAAIYGLYFLGWVVLLVSTFAICHFDLFGLRQVWLYFMNKPYTQYEFKIPWAYKYVRHPLYVGWLIIFWAAPTMSIAHLVFSLGTTVYILVAIQLEERDLIGVFGDKYRNYRQSVPMLIPNLLPPTEARHRTGRPSTTSGMNSNHSGAQ